MMAKRDFPAGGFLADEGMGFSSPPSSAFSSFSKVGWFFFLQRPNMSNPTLRHLTLRQLDSSEQASGEAPFLCDGVEISQIITCGAIRKIHRQPTSFIFTIEDGTGSLEARKWFDGSSIGGFFEKTIADNIPDDGQDFPQEEESDDPMLKVLVALKEGYWVRVVGNLRSFANKKSINIYDISPLTDFNYVTWHFSNCLYGHLYYTKVDDTRKLGDVHQFRNAPPPTSGYMYGSELSSQQQLVLNMFTGCTANEGLNIDTVCRQLKPRLSESETRSTIEWLIEEGHLYSTIDCNHAKSTAG